MECGGAPPLFRAICTGHDLPNAKHTYRFAEAPLHHAPSQKGASQKRHYIARQKKRAREAGTPRARLILRGFLEVDFETATDQVLSDV